MIRFVWMFIIVSGTVGFAQQANSVSGTITGTLKGEDGSSIAGATIRLHRMPQPKSRYTRLASDWSVVTVTGGTFQFAGLPDGYYSLCPKASGTAWLSPCEWNLASPTAIISQSQPNQSLAIILKKGVVVPIRIDDVGRLLDQHEGKTPGAGLLVALSSAGMTTHLLPIVSRDGNGRNYEIVVPSNTPHSLVVHPSYLVVHDASQKQLAQNTSATFPLFLAPGQSLSPIKFTVVGAGAK